jgi:hypothetical protein
MMRALLPGLVFAVAVGGPVLVTPSQYDTVTDFSAVKKRAAEHSGPPQQRIACTRGGCVPVPAGCSTIWERDGDDSVTGAEIIVCPPGVRR